MRPLSEASARIAGQNFKRKYVALGRIVSHWTDIVGAELACKAQPVKIHYRKYEKSKQPQASLDIAVSSADATLLHYRKDLILERINQIFGERWISAIRFINMPANQLAAKAFKKPEKPLSDDEKQSLQSLLENIVDHDIKARLESLGSEIIKEDRR